MPGGSQGGTGVRRVSGDQILVCLFAMPLGWRPTTHGKGGVKRSPRTQITASRIGSKAQVTTTRGFDSSDSKGLNSGQADAKQNLLRATAS